MMNMKKRLLATRVLVVISLIASAGALFTLKMQWGEPYPFFHWKLFSQPTGWDLCVHEYRIYGKLPGGEYVRIKIEQRKTFTSDDINYLLSYLMQLPDERERNEKLKILCQYIAPEYTAYRVVEELYNPLVIMHDFDNYERKPVVEIY
jgi:hypothetical protein